MKRLISLLIIASTLFSTIAYADEPVYENIVRIYVSATDGDDSAEGTISKPLQTIQAAQSRVRKIDKNTTKVEVILRGGEYRQKEALKFEIEDSGSDKYPVTYKAYEGEKVYIKGSVPLDLSRVERVTDEAALKRIPDDIENRVVVLDLAEQGINQAMITKNTNINTYYALNWPRSDTEYTTIYFDDNEQTIAQWPNDRDSTYWDKTVNDRTITLKEENVDKWSKVHYAWIAAFPDYDYARDRYSITSVDSKDNSITIIQNPCVKLRGLYSKRVKVYNLLEELDIPGEFYIDYDELKLYFFPPYKTTGAKLELSMCNQLLNVTRAKNIYFENLEFCQTLGSGVILNEVVNVDFYGCTFKDISYKGIQFTSSKKHITNSNHYQQTRADTAYNVNIKGCNFINIGDMAIRLSGGNLDTLTPGYTIVEDCFFHRTSQKGFWEAIEMNGVGNTVRNCLFSNIPHQGIRMYAACDLTIEYNEFHDILRENDDAGAVYGGQNGFMRNWQVNYNYIHDLDSIQNMVYNATLGIYFDEGQMGCTAHHNILANLKTGFNSHYAGDFDFMYNTIANASKASANLIANPMTEERIASGFPWYIDFEAAKADIADLDLYLERYPNLRKTLIEKINAKVFTDMVDNFAANSAPFRYSTQDLEFANIQNNVLAPAEEGLQMFVDPENHDFRLKADSKYAIANPELLNENNFDMDKIGLQRDLVFNEETAPFVLTYPVNYQKAVNSAEVRFTWEKALGADKYRLIVAEDIDFKNVVLDEMVYNSTKNITTLKPDMVYYWKVYAVNNSREFNNEWLNSNGVNVFSTARYSAPDKTPLTNALNDVKEEISKTNESDLAGEYKLGVKRKLNAYIDLLTFIIEKAPRALDSTEKVNYYRTIVTDLAANKDNLNPGFLDFGRYIKKDLWIGNGIKSINDGENITISLVDASTGYASTASVKNTTGNVINCFDMEIAPMKYGEYLCIGTNENGAKPTYDKSNTGYSVVIKNDTIELQKADGTQNRIVDSKKDICITDNKRRSYKFGRINFGFMNVCYFEIDGEPIFVWPDTDDVDLVTDAEFMIHIYYPDNQVTIYPTKDLPTDADGFNELKYTMLKKAAKALLAQYDAKFQGMRVLNVESDRILTQSGVYKIDKKPIERGEETLVSVDTVNKLFNTKGTVSNGNYSVTVDGKTATNTIISVDGTDMVSLEPLCIALGKTYLYDLTYSKDILVADGGGENLPNMGKQLDRTKELLKVLTTYEGFEFNE